MFDMTKTKKINKLIKKIDRKKPREEDIKIFSSTIIELMAQSGIPPRARQEFLKKTRANSFDSGKIIKSAQSALELIWEKA
jgi:hypothetical protein